MNEDGKSRTHIFEFLRGLDHQALASDLGDAETYSNTVVVVVARLSEKFGQTAFMSGHTTLPQLSHDLSAPIGLEVTAAREMLLNL
jgi:hypothetical protein